MKVKPNAFKVFSAGMCRIDFFYFGLVLQFGYYSYLLLI